jgi:cation transport ATPase
VLVAADTIKPTSAGAITRLRGMGLRPVLLTGDNEPAARFVADAVGITPDDVIAGVLQAGKAAAVRQLQEGGLAVGTGTDAAIEAADLQHRRHPAHRDRVPQPADRRRGDGAQLRVRRDQQPAAAPVPAR